jgi:predicted DsbA family dithiol-disulfide isomerase
MLSQVLTDGDNSENTMLAIATDLGLNKDTIKSCLDNGDMKTRVAEKFAIGTRVFKITGTPGNVLINNET